MLATTGVLRGLQDTRTPLLVAVVGNGLNIALNVVLVYGLDLGIAGSAIGSVHRPGALAPPWLVVVVVRAAREQDAPLTPDRAGILGRRPRRRRRSSSAPSPCARACSSGRTPSPAPAPAPPTSTWPPTRSRSRSGASSPSPSTPSRSPRRPSPAGRWAAATSRAPARLTRRMVQWGWGSGIVAGLALAAAGPVHRRALHHRPGGARRCSCRCCSSPRSANRSPAWCSCSTAC